MRAGLILAVPALLLTATAIARWAFGRASIDIVVFDQGLWAASRGMKPLASVVGESLLEDHFGPGIFSFAILYRLVASPIWLLVGQGVAAWAAVRLIAHRLEPVLGEVRSSFVGAALLVSPPVAYALLFDVHSIVFAVPFALAALFALEDGNSRRALFFGLVATLFRVEVGLAVAIGFAVWPGPRQGRLRWAGPLWAYLIVAFYFEKALGHDVYWPIHYGHLGASAGEALSHPFRVLGALFSFDSIAKALPWIATGGFLACRSPRRTIPVLVVALPVLLSQWGGTASIRFQYGFAPTFLLAAAWLPAVLEKPHRSRYIIAACGVMAVLIGPLLPALATSAPMEPFAGRLWIPQSEPRCIVSGIPTSAGVSATQPISLTAHRQRLYLWPYPFQSAPPTMLPAEYLAHGNADLAAGVDYLVILRGDAGLVPAGFVPDGQGTHYLRFRREATTKASERDCR